MSGHLGKALNDKIDGVNNNIIKNRVASFTSSGSWTVPAGIYEISVLLIAGGGGGSAGSYYQNEGGGGGCGGDSLFIEKLRVTPGQVIPYVIGAGGVGGVGISGDVGTKGGYTRFGDLYVSGGSAGNFYANGRFFIAPNGVKKVVTKMGSSSSHSGNAIEPFSLPKNSEWPPNMNDNDSLSYWNNSAYGGFKGSNRSGADKFGGPAGVLEIEDCIIGKAYNISGGGGGAWSGAGGSSLGGGTGGANYVGGSSANAVGCGGGGGGYPQNSSTNCNGGSGYRGEITIRY